MSRLLGWMFVIICATCAPLILILAFIRPGLSAPSGTALGITHFLIPIGISWLAMFPRSRREWRDLRHGHPFAQRYFGGKAGGFFGDYRRKLTTLGRVLLFGTLAIFLFCLMRGIVHVEMVIIAFLFLVALSSWIIRLEIGGDQLAGGIRQTATALIYRPVKHHGT